MAVAMRVPSGLYAAFADIIRLTVECQQFFAVIGIPYSGCSIITGRDNVCAIRAERHTVHKYAF